MFKGIGWCPRPRLLEFFHIKHIHITRLTLIRSDSVPETHLGGLLPVQCWIVEPIDPRELTLDYGLPTQHVRLEQRDLLTLRGLYFDVFFPLFFMYLFIFLTLSTTNFWLNVLICSVHHWTQNKAWCTGGAKITDDTHFYHEYSYLDI